MDKLIKEEFFKEFSINEDYFLSTGLDWTELEKIYEDYVSLVPLLEKEAEYVVSKLIDVSSVHSVRRRVKKPSHLIEKIIRKGKKYQERNIELRLVDTFYPSSKTCSCCGSIKKDLKLNDRIYKCSNCGLEIDRDYNASINLEKAKIYKVIA